MSLQLIVGPPNSGRAGAVLAQVRSALDRDPLLVVPTGDDIARFERDLCADGPAIGATIRTFGSLFDEVVGLTATPAPPRLSPPQRLALVRAATRSTDLRILRRSSEAPGFAPALDSLIAELQAAVVSPADLLAAAERTEAETGQERELAALFAEYERLREAAGRSDSGSVATAAVAALRADPEAWGDTPVFIYGFDDLTEVQLDLIVVLASVCDVTFAVNFSDRDALSARAGLLQRLRDEGGTVQSELAFEPGYTDCASLAHLSDNIFEPEARAIDPFDGGLALLSSAGERGEAEAVGIEIARLMAADTDPGDIVVTLRNPANEGRLFASVLREMGIPVTLEAHLPLASTAVGRGLVALCRAAAEDGTPENAIAHLRSDTAFRQSRADWDEREVARGKIGDVDGLIERWGETAPRHLRRVFLAGEPERRVHEVAVTARRLAEAAHREQAPLAGERTAGVPLDAIELRAGVAAAELLEELAEVASLPGIDAPDVADAADAIESATVRSWQGSAEGRVRILSPYRVRAGRVKHLFCCGLQEGSFPSRGWADPLIGEESRSRLGIRALVRSEQDAEERYLFSVCVSRPTVSLTLSWRSSDDEGHPAARSPFVDEVFDLVGIDPDGIPESLLTERGLANPIPRPSEATTPRALERARVARGPIKPSYKPAGLKDPAVLEAIQAREFLSAGSLERWIECSYRWFVQHELSPQRLEPDPDPLWLGGLVHEALDRLYRDPPGDDTIARPADLARWQVRFTELVDELVSEGDPLNAERSVSIERVKIQVRRFLAEEAERDIPFRPKYLERSFGFADEEEDDPGALDFGEFKLRGRIDRIDVAPDGGSAIIRDYKTSKDVHGRDRIEKEGKLQLPLYMLVAQELLHLDPIAGLYHPLAAYANRSGRGYGIKEELGEGGLLEHAGIAPRTSDRLERDDLVEALARARERAHEKGLDMRAGLIARDPLNGKCHKYCEYQPICRLERAIGLEDESESFSGE